MYKTEEGGDIDIGIKINLNNLKEEYIVNNIYDEMGKFAKYIKGLGKILKEKGTVTTEKVHLVRNIIEAIKGKLTRVRNFNAPCMGIVIYSVTVKVGKLPVFINVKK